MVIIDVNDVELAELVEGVVGVISGDNQEIMGHVQGSECHSIRSFDRFLILWRNFRVFFSATKGHHSPSDPSYSSLSSHPQSISDTCLPFPTPSEFAPSKINTTSLLSVNYSSKTHSPVKGCSALKLENLSLLIVRKLWSLTPF